jgi:hypothetical protein
MGFVNYIVPWILEWTYNIVVCLLCSNYICLVIEYRWGDLSKIMIHKVLKVFGWNMDDVWWKKWMYFFCCNYYIVKKEVTLSCFGVGRQCKWWSWILNQRWVWDLKGLWVTSIQLKFLRFAIFLFGIWVIFKVQDSYVIGDGILASVNECR